MTFSITHDPTETSAQDAAPARRILERLLKGYASPPILRLWNDSVLTPDGPAPTFTLVLRDPGLLRKLVIEHSPLLLADAYVHGAMDIEGDFYSALRLKQHFQTMHLSWRDKLALLIDAWRLPAQGPPPSRVPAPPGGHWTMRQLTDTFVHRHSRHSDRAAITYHYDVSNAFYGLWLDAQRVYSCAYFQAPTDSLDQAQSAKLEHVCRKLRLQPGEWLLDIGCGWGALVCWAARHHGVRAHGITLSPRQLEYAQERIRAEGLQGQVRVDLLDYRDLPPSARYDKVASIGMFEHVGLANMATYLQAVQRVLKPGGLFLNHGITHDEEGWNPTVDATFINRYVFPDGELDCISNILLAMERAGMEIHDVEGLRPHYALTLRHWVQRLEAQRDVALREVGETTYRVWRLYMAACALEFEYGGTGIYQILASRRDEGRWPVPWTRADVYAPTAAPPTIKPVD